MAFTPRTETYAANGNASSLVIDVPGSTADGDILFLLVFHQGQVVNSIDASWNLLGSNTSVEKYYLYYKIAASEPANYTVGFASAGRCRTVMSCYTAGDFDGADPIDVVSNTEYKTSNTTASAAAMNVSAANSYMVFFASMYSGISRTWTKPLDIGSDAWTEDDDTGESNSRNYTEICSMLFTGSGDTGVMDAVLSGSSSTNKHAFAVALNPPASAAVLSAGSGSFAETGTATTLKATRKLTATGGAFAETGTAASLKYGRKMAAASGEFLESGTAAGLRATRLLSAASGSFAETGSAATLTYEQAGALYADSGSFSLSGAIAALKYDRKLSAAGGAFAETGTAAGLRYNRKATALPGAYTLSGTAIDFLYGRVLPVGSGAFVLTGTPAALVYVHLNQYLLDAGSGTFLISGGAVTFPRPGASRICYTFRKRRDHFRI